jgi:isopenicillin-N N-acyltransferase-like protein
MRGIAEGSGIPIKVWRRINLVPELLKASCSIGGWWGPATESGQLIQLRALDWEQHCPWSRFPMITVYNSNEQGSVPFANIGWVGFLGSLTGYSSAKIGVSERLRGNSASNMTRFGKPWTYVLRDILQFSKTLDDALETLNNTDRTCSVYFGIGSSVNNTYRLIEYSAK